jgi:CHAD domain-containing protein
MAHASYLHAVPEKSLGLPVWMERVLERVDHVRSDGDADDVHDLRVALRRCRTMGDALCEVTPGSGWRKLRKISRDLFDSLGHLRDIHVQRDWVKKLSSSADPVRTHMLTLLSRQERKQRELAEEALDQFDRKDWKKMAHKLAPKAEFFPLESIVFQRLALGRLNSAADLYRQARKTRSSVAWHRLRISLKQFRYIVENFLPQRYEVWAEDLKRMQDVLGDVHDIDVLRREIRRHCSKLDPTIVAPWLKSMENERKACLAELTSKTGGPNSLWMVWRAGFQWGPALAAPFQKQRTA